MGPVGGRSPADPYFDPVWQVLNDAGIAVTYHVSEASFMHPLIRSFGLERFATGALLDEGAAAGVAH